MCVRNFHMVQLILIALLCFATSSFAKPEEIDCRNYTPELDAKYNGRCKYHRIIQQSPIANLFVIDDEKSYKDIPCTEPEVSGRKECAKADQDVKIYVPQAGTKGLSIVVQGTSEQVENDTPMNTGSSGVVSISITGNVAMDNIHVGVYAPGAEDPDVARVYNFYAPQLKYFIEGKEVTNASVYEPKVGDTVYVKVEAFIPIGPKTGAHDSVSTSLYLDPKTSENVRYLRNTGEPMQTDKGLLLNLVDGYASFMIVADKAAESEFTLEGMPYGTDKENQVVAPFPGHLTFSSPSRATLSDAAIYDADGDGVGDSIRVWLGGNMKFDTVKTFKFSWPTDDKLVPFGGSVHSSSDKMTYSLPDVVTSLQPKNAAGRMEVVTCSTIGEGCETLSSALKDSIGLVILQATVIEGRDGAEDTLALRFNKIVDTTWTQGRGLILNDASIDVEAFEKNENIWKFVVEAGLVHVGDSVKINTSCDSKKCPDGILTADDGVPTASNNQKVPVENASAIYANENSAFYDRDGDGQMDSISLGLDNAITREALDKMTVAFYWLDSKKDTLRIAPDTKDLTLSEDGKVIGYAVDLDTYDVREMLTEINPSYMNSKEYGYAVVVNTKNVLGKDTLVESVLGMHDSIAPVIAGTFLYPESFQKMEPDKFTISFTEPVATKNFVFDGECISFLVDGAWVNFDVNGAKWSDHDRSVTFYMESSVPLETRVNPGDSVRFSKFEGGVQDKFGNVASESSSAVMVMGDPRVIIKTTPYADLNRAMELEKRAKAFNFYSIDGELTEKETSSLGVLMDVNFATILKDSLGLDVPDFKKISLSMELHVYTNLGSYVGGTADEVKCNDKDFFDGNCLENPRKLYVRWNMRSDEGRKVGVGVYLAKFKIKVYGVEKDLKIERIFRWGVIASKR